MCLALMTKDKITTTSALCALARAADHRVYHATWNTAHSDTSAVSCVVQCITLVARARMEHSAISVQRNQYVSHVLYLARCESHHYLK